MAIPLAPVAITALRYGAVMLAAYGLSRRIGPGRTDQPSEDALDRVDEGVTVNRPRDRRGQTNATARWRRIVRLGRSGPAVEIDAAALGRVIVRKV